MSEVEILHRQLGPAGPPSLAHREIGLEQLTSEDIHRPTVGHDVVHIDRQAMLGVAEAYQEKAQEGA